MLPRATHERTQREAAKGRLGGRTHEIQRLIGRALRAVDRHGEARRAHDLDRLRRDQADGGTRTAADHRRLRRAGARAAHALRSGRSRASGRCTAHGRRDSASASSAGRPLLDLAVRRGQPGAEVDMNVVDDRRRAIRRAPGHGRGAALRPRASSTRCSRSPRAASASSSTCSARRSTRPRHAG